MVIYDMKKMIQWLKQLFRYKDEEYILIHIRNLTHDLRTNKEEISLTKEEYESMKNYVRNLRGN